MNITNPFLPNEKVNLVIIDGRVKKEIINNLKKLELEIILTNKCNELYDAISYHPDIVMHPINYNTLLIAPNVFDYYKELLKNKSIKLIKGEKKLKRNYPDNIAYNVARVGEYAIHNFKYTDEKLIYYLKKENIKFINVNQGYSKCSTSIINNNAIITSDKSINNSCRKYNIEVLLIKEGFIDLPGLNYGFIGGSSAVISTKEILFTGNYGNHPNYNEINDFLLKNGKTPIILSNDNIIDLGSIITLTYI